MPLHSHPYWIAWLLGKLYVRELICNLGKVFAKWLSVSAGKSLVNFQWSISHLGQRGLIRPVLGMWQCSASAFTCPHRINCPSLARGGMAALQGCARSAGSHSGLAQVHWLDLIADSLGMKEKYGPASAGLVPSSVPTNQRTGTQGLQGCAHGAVLGWHQPSSRWTDRCTQSVPQGKELQHFMLV